MALGQVVFCHVSPQDTTASVLRAIHQAGPGRLALVLPPEPVAFYKVPSLRLLSSKARESGKELLLVTNDRTILRLAQEARIPVYASVQKVWSAMEAAQVTAPMAAVEVSSPGPVAGWLTQRRLVVALCLVAVALLAVAFTPRVSVVVTPAGQPLERELAIALGNANGRGNSVKLHSMEVVVEAGGTATATGRRVEGATVASGNVLVFNETNREISLPVGTELATDGGVAFVTTSATRIPGIKAEYFMDVPVGMKAGQAEVKVKAKEPGSTGNVAAGRVKFLPNGPVGLRAVNSEAMSGGTDRVISHVTDQDITSLRTRISQDIQARANALLATKVGTDAYLLPTLTVVRDPVVSTGPKAGTEATSFQMTLQASAQGHYVLLSEIRRAVRDRAPSLVPEGYRLVSAPEVSVVGLESRTDGSRSLNVRAHLMVGGTVDPAAIVRLLAGQTPSEATRVLVESGQAVSVTVSGRPRKQLPRWTPWIRVIVEESSGGVAEVGGS